MPEGLDKLLDGIRSLVTGVPTGTVRRRPGESADDFLDRVDEAAERLEKRHA